jgi:hypothetical protein
MSRLRAVSHSPVLTARTPGVAPITPASSDEQIRMAAARLGESIAETFFAVRTGEPMDRSEYRAFLARFVGPGLTNESSPPFGGLFRLVSPTRGHIADATGAPLLGFMGTRGELTYNPVFVEPSTGAIYIPDTHDAGPDMFGPIPPPPDAKFLGNGFTREQQALFSRASGAAFTGAWTRLEQSAEG